MNKWNQQYHDKFKAFALIHKVWDQKNLEKAWKRVKANKGSAGIGYSIDSGTSFICFYSFPCLFKILLIPYFVYEGKCLEFVMVLLIPFIHLLSPSVSASSNCSTIFTTVTRAVSYTH